MKLKLYFSSVVLKMRVILRRVYIALPINISHLKNIFIERSFSNNQKFSSYPGC